MKYKKLGKSGIEVSEIGFGAWSIALDWWGKKIEEDEAKRMLKKAYDLGINFFPHQSRAILQAPNPISDTSILLFPSFLYFILIIS